VHEVFPVAHQLGVLLDPHGHVEVPRRRPRLTGVSRARHPKPHAVLDAGRNAKPPLLDLRDPPAPPAVLARDVDDAAPSATRRARLGAHHPTQEALPDRPDGPGATARGAGVRLGAAHALADPAVLYGLHLHLPVHPERRLAQGDLDLHLGVGPAAGPACGGRAEEGTTEAAVAEECLEDVLEAPERVPPGVAARSPAGHLVAVGVVGAPRLGVGEDLVGLRELLEALLGAGVMGVDVRVVVAGEPAVGLLDLRLRRPPGHAKYLVVVALGRHAQNPELKRWVRASAAERTVEMAAS
jgi:hypothetical protein